MKALEVGLHENISDAVYHGDPCPEPSLSSSIARILLAQSPLHAQFNHPRLNKKLVRETKNEMDFGSVCHRLLLGKGNEIEVINFDDFRSKGAQEARDAARAVNKIPLLRKHVLDTHNMHSVALAAIRRTFGADFWETGKSEVTLAWMRSAVIGQKPIWMRARIDRFFKSGIVFDYKTTSGSAQPDSATRRLYDAGFHIQAAFYEDGITSIFPKLTGRVQPILMFQEKEPPYACSFLTPSEGSMSVAREQVAEAASAWSNCLHQNDWPSYPSTVIPALIPNWMERTWTDRVEIAEEHRDIIKDFTL